MVMTVVCFLKSAGDGSLWNAAESGPLLKGNTCFHSIPKDTRNIIHQVGFLDIVSRTELTLFCTPPLASFS